MSRLGNTTAARPAGPASRLALFFIVTLIFSPKTQKLALFDRITRREFRLLYGYLRATLEIPVLIGCLQQIMCQRQSISLPHHPAPNQQRQTPNEKPSPSLFTTYPTKARSLFKQKPRFSVQKE